MRQMKADLISLDQQYPCHPRSIQTQNNGTRMTQIRRMKADRNPY